MRDYDLLIAAPIFDQLMRMRKKEREVLRDRFQQIAAFPGNYTDYRERDLHGRELDVHVAGRHAVLFWQDHADRQVKILDLRPADGLF